MQQVLITILDANHHTEDWIFWVQAGSRRSAATMTCIAPNDRRVFSVSVIRKQGGRPRRRLPN